MNGFLIWDSNGRMVTMQDGVTFLVALYILGGSLGTSPPIKSEIAYSISCSVSDLRLDRWAGTETNLEVLQHEALLSPDKWDEMLRQQPDCC